MTVTSTLSLADLQVATGLNAVIAGDQSGAEIIDLVGNDLALVYASGGANNRPVLQSFTGGPIDLGLDSLTVNMIGEPDIIQLSTGLIVVAFAAGPGIGASGDIYRIVVDPADGSIEAGATFVPQTTVGGTDPELTALAGGKWVCAFQDPAGNVRIQLMDGVQLASAAEINVSAAANSESDAVVTALPGGGFVVAYSQTDPLNGDLDVMAAVYDNNGGVVAAAFEAGSGASNVYQTQPAVLALADGGFAVAMFDNNSPNANQIFLKTFNATGGVGDTIGIFSATGTVVGDPDMALLPNGNILVTWTSLRTGHTDTEIRGVILAVDDDGLLVPVALSVNAAAAAVDFSLADLAGDDTDSSNVIGPGGDLFTLFTTATVANSKQIGLAQAALFFNDHVGDGASDFLVGDGLSDQASMGGGDDTMLGRGGGDQVLGEAGNDTLLGEAGDDRLIGGLDNDTLLGGDGADFINGNEGTADIMVGGAGIDTLSYSGSTAGVSVDLATNTASGGFATGDVISQFENARGSSFADTLTGAAGASLLEGQLGDDTYVLGGEASGVDTVTDTGGTDSITSTITRSLAFADYSEIEKLTLVGTSNIDGTGSAAANTISGNIGNNVLNGGVDALVDTLIGLAGNDTYVLGNGADLVQDTAGIDTITSTITRSLLSFAAIENLTLLGTGNVTGNNSANTITGSAGVNTLDGGLNSDRLLGLGGNDVLIGGAGIDTLTGGLNNDFFVFNAPLSAANRDIVTDFSAALDTFRLENAVMTKVGPVGALKGTAFFAGAAAHDANDRIVYNKATGILLHDSNGNLAGGITQLATLTNKAALTAADFVVI